MVLFANLLICFMCRFRIITFYVVLLGGAQYYYGLCPCFVFLRNELRVFDKSRSCLMMRVVVCEFVALLYASLPHYNVLCICCLFFFVLVLLCSMSMFCFSS